MTTPPSLSIPRIIPPQGERAPLTAGPVAPLPLEPNLVPSPPLRPDQVPQRGLAAPVNAAPRPVAGLAKPAYLQDIPFPDKGSYEERVLWLLARFPHPDVQAQWEAAGPPGAYAQAVERYTREVDAYAAALDAAMRAPAGAAPAAIAEAAAQAAQEVLDDEDEPTPAELAAVHAPAPSAPAENVNPPRVIFPEERKVLPGGSVIVYAPPTTAPTETAAQVAATAEKRRLGKRSKEKVLELFAAGKDRLAIAQETGLPLELVDRALEGAQRPAAVAEAGQAAERAHQQVLQAAPEAQAESPETLARAAEASGTAVVRAISQPDMSPDEFWRTAEALQRLRNGAYLWTEVGEQPGSRQDFLRQLRRMQADLGVVLARLEDPRE